MDSLAIFIYRIVTTKILENLIVMQKILIKQAKIIDSLSSWNNKTADILIENGVIQKIGENISDKDAKIITHEGLHVSPGFFDPTVNFCDPGEEHKEDIKSGIKAASKGGYTKVGVLGITHPPVTEKTRVEYIKQQGTGTAVELLPVGCVTAKNEGKELAELFDMHQSGAKYFFDGKQQLNTGMLSRALAYSKTFTGTILSYPDDKDLTSGGLMHEGLENIKLGLKGIPAMAEELGIIRDTHIAQYHDAHVHVTNVSTKKGVEEIKKAKAAGIKITAQCSVHHLFFTDSDLHNFDTNFKIQPPLRSKEDVKALIKGLKEGIVDTITSDHTPQDVEAKKMEFDLAEYGAAGIETCFAAFNTIAGDDLGLEKIIEIMSFRSRKTFNISPNTINVNTPADLVLYNPNKETTLTSKEQVSRAFNNPYLNKKLKGFIHGTINGNTNSL